MSNLSEKIIKAVLCITGNNGYSSEVKRAESIVKLFDEVPEEFHTELISFVLYSYAYCDRPGNSENIGTKYQFDAKEILFALDSEWMNEFRKRFFGACEKENLLQEMSMAISWTMRAVWDFSHHVALFALIFTYLKPELKGNTV